jgi:1-acyl-sn-glycerol-3-phosphate acyltransferase
VLAALADLAGALVPLSARRLQQRVAERLQRIPNRLNEFGFDPYGLAPGWIQRFSLPAVLLYEHYFRCRTHEIERMPAGRVLLVANHAGQLPFDGMILATALLLEAEPPRIARGMGEYWIPTIPGFNILAARGGTLVGTPENCTLMLRSGECVVVFPEGVRGMNKLYRDRYRLQRFGLGFMRLALETATPIVPVGIVGSEEQQPGLANWAGLGKLLGMPAFPVTPTFPWLGPLGLLPLPVRYHLYFGVPMHFEGDADEDDAAIERRVEDVRAAIEALLQRGLAERPGVFR